MKKANFLIFSLLVFLFPFISSASEFRQGDFVRVPAGEFIEGNLYTVAENIDIEGEISGDLVCLGSKLQLSGKVQGDVICASSDSDISGQVLGSVRLVSNLASLSGQVGRNLFFAGPEILLKEKSHLGGDLVIFSTQANLWGSIAGDVWGALNSLEIKGRVDRDLHLRIDDRAAQDQAALIIHPEALIGGDLNYRARKMAQYSEESIKGQVIREEIKKVNNFWPWLQNRFYKIFSALLVALILVLWFKDKLPLISLDSRRSFKKVFWPGLALVFMPPILSIFLALTIIGIPLAIIILLLWLISLYVSQVLLAMILGQSLLEKIKKAKAENKYLAISLGVTLLWLLYAIPVIGWLLSFVACAFGLGVLWQEGKKSYENK